MSIKHKIQYKFDNFMKKNPSSQIIGVFIAVFILILITGLLSIIFIHDKNLPKDFDTSFTARLWWSFMRVIDPGTITSEHYQGAIRIISLFATIGGILIFSILIGLLNSKILNKIEELKKGRSIVIEKNHTIILGWTEKIFTIISEIINANENHRNQCIVILSTLNATDMYDQIDENIDDLKTTRIVCRRGDARTLNDIAIPSPSTAKSIIIISDASRFSDHKTIKIILALQQQKNIQYVPIVAEMHNNNMLELAKSIIDSAIMFISVEEIISRLLVQITRQDGLSRVYSEILSFDRNEFYILSKPELSNMKFQDILLNFTNGIPVGIIKYDQVILNPPIDSILDQGDKVILLTEDDDTGRTQNQAESRNSTYDIQNICEINQKSSILILGWSPFLHHILKNIDEALPAGSFVQVVNSIGRNASFNNSIEFDNIDLGYIKSNYDKVEDLDTLNLERFDKIILLDNHRDNLNTEDKDTITLMHLLLLRKEVAKINKDINITTELESVNNQYLVPSDKINDFVIGSQIISLILAQISEQPIMYKLYDYLFSPKGSEIYIKPLIDYVPTNTDISFNTIIASIYPLGAIAIGFIRLKDINKPHKNFGIILNPDKQRIYNFSTEDKIILISDD